MKFFVRNTHRVTAKMPRDSNYMKNNWVNVDFDAATCQDVKGVEDNELKRRKSGLMGRTRTRINCERYSRRGFTGGYDVECSSYGR